MTQLCRELGGVTICRKGQEDILADGKDGKKNIVKFNHSLKKKTENTVFDIVVKSSIKVFSPSILVFTWLPYNTVVKYTLFELFSTILGVNKVLMQCVYGKRKTKKLIL